MLAPKVGVVGSLDYCGLLEQVEVADIRVFANIVLRSDP
jgi:hypothetical protein